MQGNRGPCAAPIAQRSAAASGAEQPATVGVMPELTLLKTRIKTSISLCLRETRDSSQRSIYRCTALGTYIADTKLLGHRSHMLYLVLRSAPGNIVTTYP
eukprot:SAG31_NODE_1410_length_8470_cov_6.064031_6_plen_100_part_00